MKKLLAAALMLAASFAQADICVDIHGLGAVIMQHRQHGTPLPDLLAATDSELAKALIIQAYKQPRFATEEYQAKAIQDFAEALMPECYNQTGMGV